MTLFEANEINLAAEARDHHVLLVPATDAFLEAGILAGVMSPVGIPDGPELFDVGFPMDL